MRWLERPVGPAVARRVLGCDGQRFRWPETLQPFKHSSKATPAGAPPIPPVRICSSLYTCFDSKRFVPYLTGSGSIPLCPEAPVAVVPNEEAVREAVLRSTGTVPILVRLEWLAGVLITDTPAPVVA